MKEKSERISAKEKRKGGQRVIERVSGGKINMYMKRDKQN